MTLSNNSKKSKSNVFNKASVVRSAISNSLQALNARCACLNISSIDLLVPSLLSINEVSPSYAMAF